MTHEVNFPDYLWRLAQQQSGMSNPASWIRNRIGELLTAPRTLHEEMEALQDQTATNAAKRNDPLGALGIYAKTDRENFVAYANEECDGNWTLAIKALGNKDNPGGFLQSWADKQGTTSE